MTPLLAVALLFSCFLSFNLSLAVAATTHCSMLPGTSIAPSSSPKFSPSGDFAFGFKSINNSNFLLSIYYNKISEQTPVWFPDITATFPQNLVPKTSKLQFTNHGRLILTANGNPIWHSNSTTNAQCAELLDSGNLVLRFNNDTVLWQSFDYPTDTLLPHQIMNEGTRLVSRFSHSSYATGRFQFVMQGDGNAVFYPLFFPSNGDNYAYFASRTDGENGQVNDIRLIFDDVQGLYLFRTGTQTIMRQLFDLYDSQIGTQTITRRYSYPCNNNSSGSFYHRAVLDSYGILIYYVHEKGSDTNWTPVAVIAEDICNRITTPTERGVCGCNGICKGANTTQASSPRVILPLCYCPVGYVLVDPEDSQGGCVPRFTPQKCGNKNGTEGYEMKEMASVDFPLNDLDYFQGVGLEDCKAKCLVDCFCTVAIYNDTGDCWFKRMPLTNGRWNPANGRTALIKVKVGMT